MVFQCSNLVKTSVYGKHALSTFQRNWPCTILTSVQKIAASESRAVRLFSTFRMVFPSFSARIPVNSDKLLTNRKILVVDEVHLFKKEQAFRKLMVRTGKTLCAKVVRRRAVVGNFPAFWLIFVIFPASVNPAPDVGFGKTWYFRKDCDVYFAMAQILYQSKFRLRNSKLQNKGNRRDFLVGSLFFGVDSGQLGDAFDELKEPASR